MTKTKRFVIEYYHLRNHRYYQRRVDTEQEVKQFILTCHYSTKWDIKEIYDCYRCRNYTADNFRCWY